MYIRHESLGAQVISIADFFYVSPIIPHELTSRRAGIPVIFPQFAERGPLQKHGFARNKYWNLIEEIADSTQSRIVYALEINSGDYPEWPFSAKLQLAIVASKNTIDITFVIQNIGQETFSWTGGLHPYFAVDDLLQVKVSGLKGCFVENRYDSAQTVMPHEFLTFDRNIFESLIDSLGPIELVTSKSRIKLESTGFNQWMIWNPGQDGAKSIDDLPCEDWAKFICIEPVIVGNPNQLKARESFKGTLKIEKLPL